MKEGGKGRRKEGREEGREEGRDEGRKEENYSLTSIIFLLELYLS